MTFHFTYFLFHNLLSSQHANNTPKSLAFEKRSYNLNQGLSFPFVWSQRVNSSQNRYRWHLSVIYIKMTTVRVRISPLRHSESSVWGPRNERHLFSSTRGKLSPSAAHTILQVLKLFILYERLGLTQSQKSSLLICTLYSILYFTALFTPKGR